MNEFEVSFCTNPHISINTISINIYSIAENQ